MSRKLKIRDLTLRDGQQSLFATRLTQEQINRVLPYYKDAGFFAMEVWGGAVPDSVMRYLNESPWTRLKTISEAIGGASYLTALSRGRNLFGYAPYPDTVLDGFYREAVANGLGIMRIFDALFCGKDKCCRGDFRWSRMLHGRSALYHNVYGSGKGIVR